MKLILFITAFASIAFAQGGSKLTVNISGISSEKGQLVVSVWSGELAWNDKKPLSREAVAIMNGGGKWSAENLSPGVYAVTVYHDKNSNMKMDRHWYGPPREKGAASNGAKAQTFGPPKWDDMKFELSGAETIIEIKFD